MRLRQRRGNGLVQPLRQGRGIVGRIVPDCAAWPLPGAGYRKPQAAVRAGGCDDVPTAPGTTDPDFRAIRAGCACRATPSSLQAVSMILREHRSRNVSDGDHRPFQLGPGIDVFLALVRLQHACPIPRQRANLRARGPRGSAQMRP